MDKAGIKHDPRNARKHNPRNLAQIESSIQRDGFGRSVLLANDGTVIAGNATIDSAVSAGLDDVIVVETDGTKVVAVKRTDVAPGSEQFTRLALADNRAAELASWDAEVLAGLNEEMDLSAFFQDEELNRLLASVTTEGKTDPDAVPEVKDARTKPGDLWLLGRHRLLCGDSTVATDVERLMGGERASLMATDPPYLVNYKGGNHPQSWHNKAEVKDKHWDDYNEQEGAQFYTDFISIALACALTDNPAIYQWHADLRRELVIEAWRANNLLLHQIIVWVKARPVLTRSHFMWQHEPCAYGWIQGKQPKQRPPADTKSVWNVDQQGESDGIHPTQKPVELIKRAIEYHTIADDLLYEPFSGSGTAIIAAEQTGRRCYAMELSPAFVDVAVKRWQDFTGQQATFEQHAMAAD